MSTSYIRIYYGPCESFHTRQHKPQKLTGMRDRLRRLGYRVVLKPVEFFNYCVLEMCGHVVFRCNINYLCFNTPYHRDPVCQRAINAVVEASGKFLHARNYLWGWMFLDDSIFKRSEYAPQEYWPFQVNIKPFDMECINCCGILLAKKTDEELLHDATEREINDTREYKAKYLRITSERAM